MPDAPLPMSAPLPDGVPCSHPGCLAHVSHPCEGCGRIAGRRILPLPADLAARLDGIKNTVARLANAHEFHQALLVISDPEVGYEKVETVALDAAVAKQDAAHADLEAAVGSLAADLARERQRAATAEHYVAELGESLNRTADERDAARADAEQEVPRG